MGKRRFPPPDELQAVMRGLEGWQMKSYKYFSVGWEADLRWRKRSFRLVAERGYMDVYEVLDGKPTQILPPEDQRLSISPRQVSVLLSRAVGNPSALARPKPWWKFW
jgi:hypothetical protein